MAKKPSMSLKWLRELDKSGDFPLGQDTVLLIGSTAALQIPIENPRYDLDNDEPPLTSVEREEIRRELVTHGHPAPRR